MATRSPRAWNGEGCRPGCVWSTISPQVPCCSRIPQQATADISIRSSSNRTWADSTPHWRNHPQTIRPCRTLCCHVASACILRLCQTQHKGFCGMRRAPGAVRQIKSNTSQKWPGTRGEKKKERKAPWRMRCRSRAPIQGAICAPESMGRSIANCFEENLPNTKDTMRLFLCSAGSRGLETAEKKTINLVNSTQLAIV